MANERREIVIPYCPRRWALKLHESLCRWAVLVLHRRAGKTTGILNHHQRAALDDDWERRRLRALVPDATDAMLTTLMRDRVYWHVMPSYKQAKLTAWDMLKHFASVVPGVKFNEAELLVRYPNNNRIQLIGADNPDSLRGPGLSGLSLDEYSQHPPNVFGEVLSKALADHLGYAIFAGTIKGPDQLYQMYEAVKHDMAWTALWQDIDGSLQSEDGATITALQIALEDDRKLVLQGLMTQAEYDQEWYLSPEAAIKGAWYGTELQAARAQGRITRVPYDPSLPVDTDWDLGIDAMAIWFTQSLRSGEVHVIDYHEDIGGGLPACADILNRKGYVYGKHTAPHDIEQREIASGMTRKQTAANLGIKFEVAAKIAVDDGIHAVKLLLARCWFDEEKCKHGLNALRHYKRTWNQRLNEFTATPVHDANCVTGNTKVLTRSGTHQIQYLPPTGEVLTLCGWKPYENPRITRRSAPLVAVTFADGLTVKCTPEHRFLTVNGWRFAGDLRPGLQIQSALTRSRSISMGISTAFGPCNGILPVMADYIGVCGRRLLVQFRRAATSIIAMGTPPTTAFATWNACQPTIISPQRGSSMLANVASISPLLLALLPLRGMRPKLGASGIDAMHDESKAGRSGSVFGSHANTVANVFRHWFARIIRRSTAPKPVKRLRIAHVEPLNERADVWCLTVPDGHAWALENGAIVHNSHAADAFRTFAVRYEVPRQARQRVMWSKQPTSPFA